MTNQKQPGILEGLVLLSILVSFKKDSIKLKSILQNIDFFNRYVPDYKNLKCTFKYLSGTKVILRDENGYYPAKSIIEKYNEIPSSKSLLERAEIVQRILGAEIKKPSVEGQIYPSHEEYLTAVADMRQEWGTL